MKPLPAGHHNFLNRREILRDPAVPLLSPEQITEITDLVFAKPNPQHAEVIFVFVASEGDWQQVAKLYHQGYGKTVMVTGREGRRYQATGVPLAHHIRDELMRHGVPQSALLIQDQSTNTLEDVKFGKAILKQHGLIPRAILFLCKAHHSGRALRTLNKFFPQTQLFPFTYDAAYDGVEVSRGSWWQQPIAKARVYGEYLRIQRYAARGDIATC